MLVWSTAAIAPRSRSTIKNAVTPTSRVSTADASAMAIFWRTVMRTDCTRRGRRFGRLLFPSRGIVNYFENLVCHPEERSDEGSGFRGWGLAVRDSAKEAGAHANSVRDSI